MGFDETFLCSFLPTEIEGLSLQERSITTDDTEIIKEMREIYFKTPIHMRSKTIFPSFLNTREKVNRCRCHLEQIRVKGNGEIRSCSMMLLNMANGSNIDDEEDIWNNTFFTSMRQHFLKNDINLLEEPCKGCVDNFGDKLS